MMRRALAACTSPEIFFRLHSIEASAAMQRASSQADALELVLGSMSLDKNEAAAAAIDDANVYVA